MKRYDLIIFTQSDSDACLYPTENGKWVTWDEHKEKMDIAIEALNNLRHCSVTRNSPETLNEYVDSVREKLYE